MRDRLIRTIAANRAVPIYRVLANDVARADAERLRRQTLFMGLSDGARIDTIRHVNAGLLSNEQLVQGTQVDKDKWQDLRDNLRKDLNDPQAGFRLVYLIDDFAGTGTTFLRKDKEKGWKGKLVRFRESIEEAVKALDDGPILASGWELCIHHYVASAAAAKAIEQRLQEASNALASDSWASAMHASFGTILLYFAAEKVLLAGDTLVSLDGAPLGKPAGAAEALSMLRRLQGREHEVFSAVAALRAADGRMVCGVARSLVRVAHLDEEELAGYVSGGEWEGKAGAYAIQGRAGAFAQLVEGRLDTVVGLPLDLVAQLLGQLAEAA